MSQEEVSVLFMPSGLRGQVQTGTTVLQAAQRLGVDLDSICGGQGKCRRCQVLPQEGEFSKHGIISRAEHLSSLTETEHYLQSKNRLKASNTSSTSRRTLPLTISRCNQRYNFIPSLYLSRICMRQFPTSDVCNRP